MYLLSSIRYIKTNRAGSKLQLLNTNIAVGIHKQQL